VREQVRIISHKTGWYESAVAIGVKKFLVGRCFSIVAMIALFVALFFADLFVLCQVPTNTELDIILTFCFAVFGFEFLGLSLTDASYLLGFFFWMDLLGTISMVADISYMYGADATAPNVINVGEAEGSASDNIIVVRAARAAKLGARAGRLSRVLKMLRFVPFLKSEQDGHGVKMARVISNQLTNVLSTRVAFLCIAVVVILPLFTLFTYPVVDDSMGAWTELLARNAEEWREAFSSGNATLQEARLRTELGRLSDFYHAVGAYGPFEVCYGERVNDAFRCRPDMLDLGYFQSAFTEPSRRSSIREVSDVNIRLSFDMSTPRQQEAVAGMGIIIFVVVVMCTFGMVMSNSISVIALQPLERMLSAVREQCKQIFKYTQDMQEDNSDAEEDEEYDDAEHASEFMLLERVVGKLAAIANLSSTNAQPEVTANMNDDDIMKLNWMQGAALNQPVSEKGPGRDSHGQDTAVHDLVRGSRMKGVMGIISEEVLESLETDEFNPLQLTKEQSIPVAAYLIMLADGISVGARANVQETQLLNFINTVESKYLPNPFHNFAHGVDVLASVVCFIRRVDGVAFIPEAAQFWLMIACIGHDIGHLGVNNQYLVETAHELALKYNDHSPMENMHCATLFQVTSNPESNVFAHVEKKVYKEMRSGIIAAILHTDMTKHGDMIKELGLLYQMNSEAFDELSPGSVVGGSQATMQLVLNALLHSADIANPMKPWEICRQYANLCLDEFFAQGDLEKQAGIPVQMLNDREKVNRANSQIGFIEFVIAPICSAVVNIFPQLDNLADNLGHNIQNWCDVWVEQSAPPADAASKVVARVERVSGRCEALMRSARLPGL